MIHGATIAEVFHRAGLVERWGRGTHCVVKMCKDWGIAQPVFAHVGGGARVTFRVQVGVGTPQVTPQVAAVLTAAEGGARSRGELQQAAGLRDREHFRQDYLEPLLAAGWRQRTDPDQPQSSRQRYVLTEAGKAAVAGGAWGVMTPQVTPQATPQVTPQAAAVLTTARQAERTRDELQTAAGIKDRKTFRTLHLAPLVAAGWLALTIPEKPRSPKQRYRLTDAGRAALEHRGSP